MIQQELRNASGFQGYVVSDCGAIGWMGPTKHNYTTGNAESSAVGIKAGTDLDCGNAYGSGIAPASDPLPPHTHSPTISEFVNLRTLMGCTDSLRSGVGAPHQHPFGVVSITLNLPSFMLTCAHSNGSY